MLKFLADTLNYSEAFAGVDKLSTDQLLILLEKIKVNLQAKNIQPEISRQSLAKEEITLKSEIKETGNKPRSVIECCLHCGSIRIKKCGKTKGGIQRYKCHDCGKTFSENYGLITHYTHLSEWQWLEVVRGIIVGNSITEIAKNIDASTSTVWSCRMKIYQMLVNIYGNNDELNGIVQADGKYMRVSFKGCKDRNFFLYEICRLPRHHMSKLERIEYIGADYIQLAKDNPHLLKEMVYSSQKLMVGRDTIDINHQHVCILTAIDTANNIYIEPVTAGTPNSFEIEKHLACRINQEALLVTDDHHGYKYMTRKNALKHIMVSSNKHSNGAFNLANINSLHSALDRFFVGKEYLPATKYIDLYLEFFWWLQKQKEQSPNELISRMFNLITGHVSSETRANLQRITTKDLVTRSFPIDTKGLF